MSEAPIERPQQDMERRAATTSAPPINNIRRVVQAANERGWTIVRQPDTIALVRRHPLTVEGETIGSFDVMFTCGETPGEYSLLYSETRKMRGEPAEPVSIVNVALGQKSVPLAIGSSELTTPRFERESFASGVLPAGVVKTFAEAGAHSIIISTSSIKGASTMVRVGNSGASQYFPQLVSACAQPRSKQAGLQK
jgi:hypothetical protein